MKFEQIKSILERVYSDETPLVSDLEFLLGLERQDYVKMLFDFADGVRKQFVGSGVLLRGIIEFSSFCRNSCVYCGLNKYNTNLERYRLSGDEIMTCVGQIASSGIKTVVLQSGEDDELDVDWFARIIKNIKTSFDMAVTLSVGEKKFDEYKLWKTAGADRFLLKIETTDEKLYADFHPGMSFENRIECSKSLKKLGYQNGSGSIVGLKGQTVRNIAEDILFFKREEFDMLSAGPFIPHKCTKLGSESAGELNLTLKVIALMRIVTKNTHLPANSAIASLNGCDNRLAALKVGANVIMPNFTPIVYKKLYEIYPDKEGAAELYDESITGIEKLIQTAGRTIDYSRGDSLKKSGRSFLRAAN